MTYFGIGAVLAVILWGAWIGYFDRILSHKVFKNAYTGESSIFGCLFAAILAGVVVVFAWPIVIGVAAVALPIRRFRKRAAR